MHLPLPEIFSHIFSYGSIFFFFLKLSKIKYIEPHSCIIYVVNIKNDGDFQPSLSIPVDWLINEWISFSKRRPVRKRHKLIFHGAGFLWSPNMNVDRKKLKPVRQKDASWFSTKKFCGPGCWVSYLSCLRVTEAKLYFKRHDFK